MTKFKEIRQRSGMTQSQLANKSGLNLRTLQYYEQGAKPLNHARIDTILKLCIELDCEIGEIIEDSNLIELYNRYIDINYPTE